MKSLIGVCIVSLFAAGCAFTPHDVALSLAAPEVANASVGEGTAVRLRVLDERDEAELGNRGAGISVAEVTADGLMPEFTRVVREGFEAKGYTLTENAEEADADLDIALRSVKFDETSGFWTVGANVAVTILAEAEKGEDDYKNTYRVTDEERQFAISTGGGIDESINGALNEALGKLFSDEKLDSFLTGVELPAAEEPAAEEAAEEETPAS